MEGASLWFEELNLYKEQVLKVEDMKHEGEVDVGTTFLNIKWRRIKHVKKLPTMVDLGKVIFLGCIHANVWALYT